LGLYDKGDDDPVPLPNMSTVILKEVISLACRCGSSDRVPALQRHSPEFKTPAPPRDHSFSGKPTARMTHLLFLRNKEK
jgi:hypothetical protein